MKKNEWERYSYVIAICLIPFLVVSLITGCEEKHKSAAVEIVPTDYPTKEPYIAPLETKAYEQWYFVNVYPKGRPQYTICADQYIIHIKWQVSQDIYFFVDHQPIGEVKDFQEMTVFPMSQEQCELYLHK